MARRCKSGSGLDRGSNRQQSGLGFDRILYNVEDVYGRGARGDETGINAGLKRGTELRCLRFGFAGNCWWGGFRRALRVVRRPRETLPSLAM